MLEQHSFQEVMQQLNRMCSHYQNCEDSGCPLFDECGNIGSHSSNAKQAMRIEKTVMAWAAENPEPVYPAWCEWLQSIGVLPKDQTLFHRGLDQPIPADIAEKLGLQPK